MPSPRRTLLAQLTSLVALSGCLGERSEPPLTNTGTSPQPTPTESPASTESPTPAEPPTEPLVYPFSVVNHGETERCVELSVRPAAGAAVASGTYRVAGGDVLRFTDATTVGTRYTVELRLSDGRSLTREWTPERCLDGAGGREASKAGYAAFDADSCYLAENGCDAVSRFLQHPSRVDPDPDECSV